MRDYQREIIDYYTRNAEAYVNKHPLIFFWEGIYEPWQRELPSGQTILEIGCGGGRDTRDLLELGYDLTSTDLVPEFIEIASSANPDAHFIREPVDVLALDQFFAEAEFDSFWAAAVLLHMPYERVTLALQQLCRVINPGGIGFIAIKEGSGLQIEEDESGTRAFFYWQDEDFRKELQRAGFEIVEYIYRPMSERTKWLMYIVRKISDTKSPSA